MDLEPKRPWSLFHTEKYFADPKISNGYLKANSHHLFNRDTVCLWVDSNLTDIRITSEQLANFAQISPITSLSHMQRSTVRAEMHVARERQLEASSGLQTITRVLDNDRFPDNVGLTSLMFLARDHRDPRVAQANSAWWEIMTKGVRREQLSFDYCAWKAGIRPARLRLNYHLPNRYFRRVEQVAPAYRQIQDLRMPSSLAFIDGSRLQQNTPPPNKKKCAWYCGEAWGEKALEAVHAMTEQKYSCNCANGARNYVYEFDMNRRLHMLDPSFAWQREYLRRSVRGCRTGLAIGLNNALSVALLLASEEDLHLGYVECSTDPTVEREYTALRSVFPDRVQRVEAVNSSFFYEWFARNNPELVQIGSLKNPRLLTKTLNQVIPHLADGHLVLLDNCQTPHNTNVLDELSNAGVLETFCRGFPAPVGSQLFLRSQRRS